MGFRLHGVFRNAGLPAPEMHLDAALGGGPDWAGYALIGDVLRTRKSLLRFGGATEAEIDSYEERLRAEALDHAG